MLTLAATNTLAAGSSNGLVVLTVFGMELNAGTEVYKILFQGQLGATPATVYTVPGSTEAFVKSVHAVNLSGNKEAFALFTNGLGDANRVTSDISLGVSGWAVYDENGWQIYGDAVTMASLEMDNGPTLMVVDITNRRLLEKMSLRLDEMAANQQKLVIGRKAE